MSTVWEELYQPKVRDNPAAPVPTVPDDARCGLDLSFFFDIAASIGTVADQMREDRARRDYSVPGRVSIAGAATTNSSGHCAFVCAGPQLGRLWQVRVLVVGGIKKGVARLYATATQPIAGQTLDLFDMRTAWTVTQGTTTLTVKQSGQRYGTGQIIVVPMEKVWCVVTTATATVEVTVSGRADDYPVGAGAVDIPV